MQPHTLTVTVNGQPRLVPVDPGAPFLAVMDQVRRQVLPSGDALTRVVLNGTDITGQRWDNYLHLTAADLTALEVESGNINRLARDTLTSLDEFLAATITELERVVKDYRSGRDAEAAGAWARVLDGLQVISHTTALVERHLGVDTRAGDFGTQPVTKQLARLEPILEDMFAAQKSGDNVLLADLMEYELIPYLHDRRHIMHHWAEQADAVDAP